MLLDADEDGQLVFEEVTMYIASVLRVVCAVGQDMTGEHYFRLAWCSNFGHTRIASSTALLLLHQDQG